MRSPSIRVLLVDDHAVVRNGVRLMLGAAPEIRVIGEAATERDALALVQAQDFDVALVDIALPGRSGLELLKRLRLECPRLAVLMLSMYSEDIYALRALKLGAAGYLTKDCPADSLIAAVRKAHAGGKYLSAQIVDQMVTRFSDAHVRPSGHQALTDRELEVLKLIVHGKSLASIAASLHLSPSTITTYRARICKKLELGSNAEMTRYAMEHSLLP
ncbi:MAG: response regulator transcription factor [Polaromonas sp.]